MPEKATPKEAKPVRVKTELAEAITQFLEYCEVEKQLSRLTLRNYDHYLGRFAAWGAKNGVTKPSDISIDAVRSFRLWLNRQPNRPGDGATGELGRLTQNYHVIAIRALLKYLAKRDVKTLAADKIELGKTERRSVEFLTPEETERLLESAGTKDTFTSLRDRAILELLYSTGLRVSELCSLDTDQVNAERGEFMVRGKGDKPRLVFLSDRAAEHLRAYLLKRKSAMKPLLTRSDSVGGGKSGMADGEADGADLRLTPRSIQRIIKKYTAAAGLVKDVTPHTLRHSFATGLLRNGADIRSVQQMLGHASITTTQVYTHVTNPQLREVHKKFHGKG
ncbi:MAG: tyrosine-type recombinase/integrase [Patescibacteria group bacterium]|nr:tyrosine-type recombinase/integrase [Patescibacteria group bacterium]